MDGGGGTSPLTPYAQLALYTSGNALAILLGLLVWSLNRVLAEYRDAAIYALLCSMALRGPKDFLVRHLDAQLGKRSLCGALLSLALLPLSFIKDMEEEVRALFSRWQQLLVEQDRSSPAARGPAPISSAASGWGQAAQSSRSARSAPRGRSPCGRGSGPRQGLAEENCEAPLTGAQGSSTMAASAETVRLRGAEAASRGAEEASRAPAAPRSADAAKTPAQPSPHTPRGASPGPSSRAPATLPTLAMVAGAGVKALQSRRSARRRRRRTLPEAGEEDGGALDGAGPEGESPPQPASASAMMFRWLFRACALRVAYQWALGMWSTTVQVLVLAGTLFLGLAGAALLVLSMKWSLARAANAGASPARLGWRGSAESSQKQRRLFGTGVVPSTPGRASPYESSSAAEAAPGGAGARARHSPLLRRVRAALLPLLCLALSLLRAARRLAGALARRMDARARAALRGNLHATVAAALIAALVLGSCAAGGLLAARVLAEGRDLVLRARDAFPAAWAGVAARTPLLVEAVGGEGELLGWDAELVGRDGGQCPTQQGEEKEARENTGEEALQNGEDKGEEALRMREESQHRRPEDPGTFECPDRADCPVVLDDAGAAATLFASAPPDAPHPEDQCPAPLSSPSDAWSDASQLPTWLRPYRLAAGQAAQRVLPALASWVDAQVRGFVTAHNLTLAVADARLLVEASQGPRECPGLERTRLLVRLARADVAAAGARQAEAEAGEALRGAEGRLREAVLALERLVAEADAALGPARERQREAASASTSARRQASAARARRALCAPNPPGSAAPAAAAQVPGAAAAALGRRLQEAYATMWRGRVRAGLAQARAVAGEAAAALSGGAGAQAAAVDLSQLQRLAGAALEPLGALARVALASLGSTTATALMGTLGMLRLGLGLVKAGLQGSLFLALLYYLLSAEKDPLLAAAAVLPLSEAGRRRAGIVFARALRGVFVATIKLVVFHFFFAWLTFSVLRAPMPATAALGAAACALLPFVPTYAVALPGAGVVALQGRLPAALLLAALHVGAYAFGDTLILEDIPGGHPYLLSLGILGGIWTFDNALRGAILGPLLLSLLAAFYSLHSELMTDSRGVGGGLRSMFSPAPAARGSPRRGFDPGSLRPLRTARRFEEAPLSPWISHLDLDAAGARSPPPVAGRGRGAGGAVSPRQRSFVAGARPAAVAGRREARGSRLQRGGEEERASEATPGGLAGGWPLSVGPERRSAAAAVEPVASEDDSAAAGSFSFNAFAVLAHDPAD